MPQTDVSSGARSGKPPSGESAASASTPEEVVGAVSGLARLPKARTRDRRPNDLDASPVTDSLNEIVEEMETDPSLKIEFKA